jgi:hypothetical protein
MFVLRKAAAYRADQHCKNNVPAFHKISVCCVLAEVKSIRPKAVAFSAGGYLLIMVAIQLGLAH